MRRRQVPSRRLEMGRSWERPITFNYLLIIIQRMRLTALALGETIPFVCTCHRNRLRVALNAQSNQESTCMEPFARIDQGKINFLMNRLLQVNVILKDVYSSKISDDLAKRVPMPINDDASAVEFACQAIDDAVNVLQRAFPLKVPGGAGESG